MTPTAWLSVATICALGAVSPGPSLAVVVRHSMRSRMQGVACALAHSLGIGLYALATVLGLAAVLVAHPLLYRTVAIGGAIYLLWLGLRALGGEGEGPDAPAGLRRDLPGAARDGFAIAVLNPKVAIFFMALFSQFVEPRSGVRDTVILSMTALGIDAIWYLLVAMAFSGSAVGWLRRRQLAIDRITAALLIAVAAWTLMQALRSAV